MNGNADTGDLLKNNHHADFNNCFEYLFYASRLIDTELRIVIILISSLLLTQ